MLCKLRTTTMNAQKLILLVKKHEQLYNMNDPDYNNQQRRDMIWEEIGKIMGQSGYDCKDRWIRIRDNFRKAVKLRKRKSGLHMKPPKYEKILNFLLPHFNDFSDIIPNISSSISRQNDETDNESIECKSENIDTDSDIGFIKCEGSRKRDRSVSPQISFVKKNKGVASISDDNLNNFFITMAQTVKTFPLALQVEVKRKIFNVVNDAEAELVNKPFFYQNISSTSSDPLQVPSEPAS